MGSLKACLRNGRLVLDEPTDLPEGTVVERSLADPFAALADEDRAALNASIDRGVAQARDGQGRPLDEFLDEL